MLRRVGRAVSCMAAVPVGLLGVAPASVAATLPKAIEFWGMKPNYVAVRPEALTWHTDLGPSFNGVTGNRKGQGPVGAISWTSWTAAAATGSGDLWVPHEHGQTISWTTYPARLRFSVPRTLSVAVVGTPNFFYEPMILFTRITVSFKAKVPARWRRSASFTLKRNAPGLYGFAFPR